MVLWGRVRENNPFMYQLREQNAQLAACCCLRYHTDRIHDAEVESLVLYSVNALRHKGLPNGGAIYVVLQPFFVLLASLLIYEIMGACVSYCNGDRYIWPFRRRKTSS